MFVHRKVRQLWTVPITIGGNDVSHESDLLIARRQIIRVSSNSEQAPKTNELLIIIDKLGMGKDKKIMEDRIYCTS